MSMFARFINRGWRFKEDDVRCESNCDVEFVYMTLEELLKEHPEAKHYPLDGDDLLSMLNTHNKSLSHWVKAFSEEHKTKSVKVFTSGIWCEYVRTVASETLEDLGYKGHSEANYHIQVKE